MPVLPTLLTLLLITAGAVARRLRWPRLTPRTRRRLSTLTALLLVLPWLPFLSGWESASIRLNQLCLWLSLLGYVLVVVFFTLLRPRRLTVPIAAVMLLPLLASSVLALLSGLFDPRPYRTLPVGAGYFLETAPWSSGPGQNSGVDWDAFYRPEHLSFLRRGIRGGRLYNSQCRTDAVFGTLDLRERTLLLHCPPLTPTGQEVQHLLRLR